MHSTTLRVFTHECRAEAVKLVTEQPIRPTEAAKKMALSVKSYCCKEFNTGAFRPSRKFE